jgi:hypothetical protein
VKPYRICKLTAHLDRIIKEAEIKYGAVTTREVNCILKQSKISLKNDAFKETFKVMLYGTLLSPIGMDVGGFAGLASRMAAS